MSNAIMLESIQNFRDFGGYAAGARKMKRGLLYRSGQPAFATDNDLARLRDFNFATIIDLRRPSERELRPSPRWEGFSAQVIEAGDEYESDVVWLDFMRASDLSASAFREYLTQFYTTAPLAPRHIELFTRYFETLASGHGPLLVHCAGGKDRTGMICALTHTMLGVHRDDVMEDFLATNNSVRFDEIGPRWAKDIAEEIGREPLVENLKVAMSVEPGYLDAAFGAMRARYGSVDNYLEQALGVDAGKRAAIEQRILV